MPTLAMDRYAAPTQLLLAAAQELADVGRHEGTTGLHLLVAMLGQGPAPEAVVSVRATVRVVLRRSGADPDELLAAGEKALAILRTSKVRQAFVTVTLLELLERAAATAEVEGALVGPGHLLRAIAEKVGDPGGALLQRFGVGWQVLTPHLDAFAFAERAERDTRLGLDRFTPAAADAVRGASELAAASGHPNVLAVHLFASLLERDASAREALNRAGASAVHSLDRARAFLSTLPSAPDPGGAQLVCPVLGAMFSIARAAAKRDKQELIGVLHLLEAFAAQVPNQPAEILWSQGIRAGSLRREPVRALAEGGAGWFAVARRRETEPPS